jgi:hypothetical protein
VEVKPVLKRIFLLACPIVFLAISATAASAVATAPADKPEYTSAQIRKMIREAHTVQQYTVLADYYQTRRRMYQRKAAEEMHLWAERNAIISPVSEKWPRPVDSARNLHDYFENMADDSAAKVAHFNQLADSAPYQ